mgnify:CR=1 FL=1
MRAAHFLQLLVTYFQSSNLILMNLWLIAIVKELNISYMSLNKNYQSYLRFKVLSATLEDM